MSKLDDVIKVLAFSIEEAEKKGVDDEDETERARADSKVTTLRFALKLAELANTNSLWTTVIGQRCLSSDKEDLDVLRGIANGAGHNRETTPRVAALVKAKLLDENDRLFVKLTAGGRRALKRGRIR